MKYIIIVISLSLTDLQHKMRIEYNKSQNVNKLLEYTYNQFLIEHVL